MKKFITFVFLLTVFVTLTSCTADAVDQNKDDQSKSASGGDTMINPIKHR